MCYPGNFRQPDEFRLRKDERVTCENDHVICVVAEDVKRGASAWPKFRRWQDPEPTLGAMPPMLCCRCNAPWLDGRGFHIGTGKTARWTDATNDNQ